MQKKVVTNFCKIDIIYITAISIIFPAVMIPVVMIIAVFIVNIVDVDFGYWSIII